MGQLSKPTRDGYKLTYDGELQYQNWLDLGGCTCFTGCAPCSSCTHEGHPYSLEEDDEAWEPEFTEYVIDYTDDRGLPSCEKGHCAGSGYCVESCPYFEKLEELSGNVTKIYCKFIEEEPNEMSRDNITNKGSGNNNTNKFKVGDKVKRTGGDWSGIIKGEVYTVSSVVNSECIKVAEVDTGVGYADCDYFELVRQPEKHKSEWFGFKYKVNPETSKFLQEAVFKDGGDQVKNYLFNKPHLFVSNQGSVTWGDEDKHFDEHPLPEKEPPQPYKIKWNSCVDHGSVKVKDYFELTLPESNIQPQPSTTLNTHKHNGLCKETPLTSKPIECTLGNVVTVEVSSSTSAIDVVNEVNKFLNQQEESNMSNANRRVVNVKLLDNDSGLPVENALVAQFDNIVTEDSNDVVVQEILLNKNIADAIAKHNQKRVEQTDLEILNRTGNDVKLRPVKLKDLTWVVTTA